MCTQWSTEAMHLYICGRFYSVLNSTILIEIQMKVLKEKECPNETAILKQNYVSYTLHKMWIQYNAKS